MTERLPFVSMVWWAAITFVTALLLAGPSISEPRIALVVGNGSYDAVTPLDNPISDARLMAKTLEAKGFSVTLLTDSDQASLNRAIAVFGGELRQAGSEATGLFFYAGHGVQSFGTNYLLPVDARLTNAADVGLVAIPAESVLRQMFSARNKTNIVILDACRNNPFDAIPDMNDNGLAEMKAPTGTFLAYSTAPGTVALDGLDGNSPFTKALAEQMNVAGAPIEQVFKQVRVDVLGQSNGMQTPWDTSSLTAEFYFVEATKESGEDLAERQLWDSVRNLRDPVQLLLFMRAYPNSRYGSEARTLLGEVMESEVKTQVEVASPEPSSVAVVPVTPSAQEKTLIDVAQKSGLAADYKAYLAKFPQGIYAELANFELGVLATKAASAPASAPELPVAALAPLDLPNSVAFSVPLSTGGPGIEGLSLEQLAKGSPLFPPIEGIPEALWKGQQCSNCHKWTRDALCAQGKTYLDAVTTRALVKEHPYGGMFKQILKVWAEADCQ